MRQLNEKISKTAPVAAQNVGTDFQAFIMRERESIEKSASLLDKEMSIPIISSLAKH